MTIRWPTSPARRSLPALALAIVFAGCATSPTAPTPAEPSSSTLPAGAVALPTYSPTIDGQPQACAGVGYAMDVRIHGSKSDPALAWVNFPDGHRENLLWPPGYYAEFSSEITVFNPNGTVVAREDQLATGGCPMEPNGLMIDLPTVPATPKPS